MNPPCADCGTKPSRLRGICSTCYSRRRRAGTLDQLPPPIISRGTCKRGHSLSGDNLAFYGKRPTPWCRQCGRDRLNARRAAKRAEQAAAEPPKPNPQPKVETPKPKPVKAPKSKLPPGWDRVTPAKVHPKPGQAGHGGGGKILEVPLTPELPAAIRRKAAARLLAMGAADLLAALGLEDAA